jgi:superfamily I DNA and/or RNA helicase
LKEWQKALQQEIIYLKKYGSTKYRIKNGRLLANDGTFQYYFDTSRPIQIPIGSIVRIEWGLKTVKGRMLSSEGKGIIVSLDETIGDDVDEILISYDPWELLEQLLERLGEIKESKKKRARIKRLMNPPNESKHPRENIQSSVHELILRSKYNPITFVWGPPGTGKTYTLARLVANKYFKNQRILVVSHSNQAVNVLMAEIYSFIHKKGRFREGDLLRYGNHQSEIGLTTAHLLEKRFPDLSNQREELVHERRVLKQDLSSSFSRRDSETLLEVETKLSTLLEKIRQKEIEFVKDADVIGTTLAKAATDPTIYEKEYDLVVLDEASMAYVPQVAFASSIGKRLVVCGDFKQLPPIAVSRHEWVEKWLKNDIFTASRVIESLEQHQLHPNLFLLKEQRRMHPQISSFTNKHIYHSLVGDHESVVTSRVPIAERIPFPSQAAILLDTSGTGEHCMRERSSNSRMNPWQLLLSFQLIHEAYMGGNRSIGYVTPYRAQADSMDLLLEELYSKERNEGDIVSATVHRFQGSERDVMIFDTVEGYPESRAGMLLIGKESERLVNVAITRTKGKFIHVSHNEYIREKVYRSQTLRKLVEHQLKMNQVVKPSQIGTWIQHQHPRLTWMHAKKIEKVSKDVDQAVRTIIISIPNEGILTKDWLNILNSRGKRVKLTCISSSPLTGLNADHHIAQMMSFPYLIIDDQILWLGVPFEAATRSMPPYVAARLDAKKYVEYFKSQLPLET